MHKHDPRMTADEYGMWLVGTISNLPAGNERDLWCEHFANFRAELDHLELCFELDPYQRPPDKLSD